MFKSKLSASKRVAKTMTEFAPVLMLLIMSPSVAHAYIDPGSGSVFLSTLLGFIAAIGYTFRKYFYKIRRVFRGKEELKVSESSANDSNDPAT